MNHTIPEEWSDLVLFEIGKDAELTYIKSPELMLNETQIGSTVIG